MTDIPQEKVSGLKRPRQARSIKRRQHLSNVVVQLVQEKGFDAVSVNEVAKRASMSVGGLYRHIETKSDLLEMVCDEINLDLLEEIQEVSAKHSGIEGKLDAAIRVYWERHWDVAPAIIIAYREYQSLSEEAKERYKNQEKKIASFFGDIIRAGVLIDTFRPVDEKLLAYEIVLLAHMRALKGHVMKDMDKATVLEEHLKLIFFRLRKEQN
ncbi:TetR/AcrR family transcriptional regulator [Zhongshania aliphaticivorans]|uniref:TetR/AcrR family transcriptional regulator n=1 Tax=Zhongshania aliphaticivorans TaxID=1470434 RepID=UPI0012E627BF|nr:TetR/AcrR family transcriptional regulator [Zhongshania aliphaticivorans]CAA0106812.1 HTH-type transcriptional regulator BetI [Zhongshania aliphaticivorans]